MADHLQLPPGVQLPSRRTRGRPISEQDVHRFGRARLLNDSMATIEAYLGFDDDADEDADDEADDARAVLKFKGTTRLSTGPLSKLKFVHLGEDEQWTYYVLSSRESRLALSALIAQYGQLTDGPPGEVDWNNPKAWAGFLDHIEGVELYGPEDRADASLDELTFEPVSTIDCLVWPSAKQATASKRIEGIRGLVDAAKDENPDVDIRVIAVDSRPDRTLVRVSADRSTLGSLLEHPDVERVRAPLSATITQEALTQFAAPRALPDPGGAVIGVVDGVVDRSNPMIKPFLESAAEFPPGHAFSGADTHGTAVAGSAVWGDLDAVLSGPLPEPFPIVSARVMDIAPGGRVEVVGLAHETMEEAVRWLVTQHDVRLICISIAYPTPAHTALRNELTYTLDLLSRELGVVIVVAAGNRTTEPVDGWLDGYPAYLYDSDAGVASPGDGALVVTVGSFARRNTPSAGASASGVGIAGVNEPSPFTRTGPVRGRGAVGAMKPEFSHHGGNWAYDTVLGTVDGRNPGVSSVVTIPPRSGRIVGSNNGTSFAAPSVAREIARIADRHPDAGPNLLRALTALSARRVPSQTGDLANRRAAAYGEPDAERVLESTTNRVFLTFEGEIPTNRVVVHRLPIPPAFADGSGERGFRVSLAFDPPVRRQRREYIAGAMSVELVRGISIAEIERTYSKQPTNAELEENPALTRASLPDNEHRPFMDPGSMSLASNTLIRRDFTGGSWDPDHEEYALIISHNQSAWTAKQRREYDTQPYALAVEVAVESRTDLDLYALIRNRLRQRIRVRRP